MLILQGFTNAPDSTEKLWRVRGSVRASEESAHQSCAILTSPVRVNSMAINGGANGMDQWTTSCSL